MSSPPTILCLASFFKGGEFMREAARTGARVVLITRDKLCDREWPRDCLDELIGIEGRPTADAYLEAAVHASRTRRFDRVVALEEMDVMTAALLREELGIPGASTSSARLFQDKLTMRARAREEGLLVPEFVHTLNVEAIADFLAHVPPPWMLKPRIGASAMGIHLLATADDVWAALHDLDSRDDDASRPERHLLERFIPGVVFHVDSLSYGGEVVFESVERYGVPPFDVVSRGGIATSHTVERGSSHEATLLALNREVLGRFGFESGTSHVEFILGVTDGRFYFLEAAARVGGAYTAETIRAATGVNVWEEWARIETATPDRPYRAPDALGNYGGVAVSLARQEHPDTTAYTDPEIVYRVQQAHHVGLVVGSSDHDRVVALLDEYARRFAVDFTTSAPLEDSPARYL